MLDRFRFRPVVILSAVTVFATCVLSCAPAATGNATSVPAPTLAAAAPAKPAASAAAVSSPPPTQQPSAVASPSVSSAAPKPATAQLRISFPSAGQSVPAGSVQATVNYTGPTLVAAASATKLDDYHLHYLLDEDATPYLGTSATVPAGNPRIIHTAATQVTFDNIGAGPHTLVVMLSGSNHVSVNPAVSDRVTFTVS
jgi:hypothetical protein